VGFGVGVVGFGVGAPTPNPQSPIPNPQSPYYQKIGKKQYDFIKFNLNLNEKRK
jgi:hypothetical protein